MLLFNTLPSYEKSKIKQSEKIKINITGIPHCDKLWSKKQKNIF